MTDTAWQAMQIDVGTRVGRWEIVEELSPREFAKPKRNPHGGISRPRVFSLKCSVCGTTKVVQATGVRRFISGRRDPDMALKCACVVEEKKDDETERASQSPAAAETPEGVAAKGTRVRERSQRGGN